MDIFLHLSDIVRNSWFRAGRPGRVLIAFSGGADSCALLHALHRFSAQNNGLPMLFAAHVDHGLRPESASDASFAEAVCRRLDIPFFNEKVSLASASEDDARQARYKALFRISSQTQADAIALAHHIEDQSETVLLHLMRGSVQGLGGMQECSRHGEALPLLWRPFLQVSPALLRDALRQEGIAHCEDLTNQSDRYLRNHIRLHVLPSMRSRAGCVDAHIAQAASVLHEEGDFLNDLADTFLSDHAVSSLPCPFIVASAFEAQHAALRRRVIRRFFSRLMPDAPVPDFAQLTACAAIQNGKKVNLPAGCTLFHDGVCLHLLIPHRHPALPSELHVLPFQPGMSNGKTWQAIPKALYPQTTLRYRRQGDFIRPFGMQGHKSLQDYLTDRKIPAPFRDHLPLLCIGQEVIWVIGVGAGERMRALPDGKDNLLLHYPAPLPLDAYHKLTKET